MSTAQSEMFKTILISGTLYSYAHSRPENFKNPAQKIILQENKLISRIFKVILSIKTTLIIMENI